MSLTGDAPFLILEVEVAPPVDLGPTGAGRRRYVPIIGGRVSGEVAGEILPGGADWQTAHDDGNLQIDAHYAFRTDAGDVVEVRSTGVRSASPEVLARLAAGELVDGAQYYFRTAIRFTTGSEALRHLNFRLGMARGERLKTGVRLEVFEIL